MKGTVVQVFEKTSQKTGKKYYNVMMQEESGIKGYLTSTKYEIGKEAEYNVDPPSRPGDTPWIRGMGSTPYGQRQPQRSGNVKAFACSYAKDLAVALINSPEGTSKINELDDIMEHYYKWFMEHMKEE